MEILPESTSNSSAKSLKQSDGETPFSLTYGSEAVIPAEIDLLQERREATAIREAEYKTNMERYYNKKVRLTSFNPGEFVFKKNEASRVEDQGKLGPTWEGPYRVMKTY
nr:reverse transcriptase domain-containing protein [Tanacetum cinerariifolium]